MAGKPSTKTGEPLHAPAIAGGTNACPHDSRPSVPLNLNRCEIRPFTATSASKKPIHKAYVILAGIALLICMITTFFESMTFYDHDEEMYLSAVRQIMEGRSVYRDFAFCQTPYMPLIFAAVFKIAGTSHYLLTGKLINFLLWLFSVAVFYLSARRFSRDATLAGCLLVLYVMNFYVIRISIVTTNYILPLTFSMLGSYLLLTATTGGWKERLQLLGAGLCMGLAAGAKLLYLPLLMPLLVTAFYKARATHGQGHRGLWRMWPLAAGVAVGLLPLCFYFLRDTTGFIFFNVGTHVTNIEWRKQTGQLQTLDVATKLPWVLGLLKDYNFFIPLLWLSFLLIGARRRLAALTRDFRVVFFALCTGIALAVACYPSPLWPTYFAIPIPYWLLLLAALHAAFHRSMQTINRRLALAVALMMLVLTLPQKIQKLATVIQRSSQSWPGFVMHRDGQEIRAILEKTGLQGKVATLSPLTPLEADLPVYSQLSFVYYRIGDFCSAEQREGYHFVCAQDIGSLLEADPPAAILTGIERDLDGALIRFAEFHHYKKMTGLLVGTLYLRQPNGEPGYKF